MVTIIVIVFAVRLVESGFCISVVMLENNGSSPFGRTRGIYSIFRTPEGQCLSGVFYWIALDRRLHCEIEKYANYRELKTGF